MDANIDTLGIRRALLLGAPAPDLRGVERDIELMSEALQSHGFEREVVLPATRAAIIDALDTLIVATGSDDAVVVYYSGHGALSQAPENAAAAGEQSYYRFLVASDFAESTEEDFRGYTNIELSLSLDRLTEVTTNVTVIMDCCYAGRVFRADDEKRQETVVWQDTSRYLPTRFHEPRGRWERSAHRHYEKLHKGAIVGAQLDPSTRDSEANPHPVMLLASAIGGKAYEARLREGGYAGAMTHALHGLLMNHDPRHMTWQDLGRMLRMTPRRSGHDQSVSVEGPYRRLLFQTREREPLGAVEIDLDEFRKQISLAGGRLADLAVDEVYELVELVDIGERVIGRARVELVESSHARLKADVPFERLHTGCWARRIHTSEARAIVELEGFDDDESGRSLLTARLGASGLLQVRNAGSFDPADDLPRAARVRLDGGKLQLTAGSRSFDMPRSFDLGARPCHARQLADHISDGAHLLARQARLEHLHARSPGDLDGDWTLECMRVEHGQFGPTFAAWEPDTPHSASVCVGEHLSVRLRTSFQSLYMSVFMLWPDGRIELLSRSQGAGVEVDRKVPEYILGQRSFGPLRGVELREVPRVVETSTGTFELALLAIVSNKAVDLRSWTQPGIGRFRPSDAFAPASSTRDFKAATPRHQPARYRIFKYLFNLEPKKT